MTRPRNAKAMPGTRKRRSIQLIPIPVVDEIKAGDDIAGVLIQSLRRCRLRLQPGDVLVIKHKIISKAEGQFVDLVMIEPSPESVEWGKQYDVDPRVIELALKESRAVIRRKNGVLITETRHGFLCANGGIDASNVDGGRHAVLLPEDPDHSAEKIRQSIKRLTGFSIAVIISDSFGRPWREGLTEFAIGVSGINPLRDDRGQHDPHGYTLKASVEAIADELACAAGLVCGKLNRTPACIVRGFPYQPAKGSVKTLLRPAASDLFR